MFTTFIVQPIFNILALIYALIPGHNFGLSIILFTIVVRCFMWPLVKKQLHQVKVMRKLQPELRAIKKRAKNRQEESVLVMELYKERGVNPFASIGVVIPQIIILLGLYNGLLKVLKDPNQIIDFSYSAVQQLPWMRQLAENIHMFDETLFGWVDLTRAAVSDAGFYWPALIVVIASVIAQYFQSKQLMPSAKDGRRLRDILKAAGQGKEADQSEVQDAVGRSMLYVLPAVIFVFTIGMPSALGLYWAVGGIVAIIQQTIILREDEVELQAMADKAAKRDVSKVPEAEVVEAKQRNTGTTTPNKKKKSAAKSKKKRRK